MLIPEDFSPISFLKIFPQSQYQSYHDLWANLSASGILDEGLLDCLWADAIEQKTALLGLMAKFDLIAERHPVKVVRMAHVYPFSFHVI